MSGWAHVDEISTSAGPRNIFIRSCANDKILRREIFAARQLPSPLDRLSSSPSFAESVAWQALRAKSEVACRFESREEPSFVCLLWLWPAVHVSRRWSFARLRCIFATSLYCPLSRLDSTTGFPGSLGMRTHCDWAILSNAAISRFVTKDGFETGCVLANRSGFGTTQ